jgi:uncharacterized circularly permuted ATP-grasp superfamily protein/uncharacterized alpha-E superfamily protein
VVSGSTVLAGLDPGDPPTAIYRDHLVADHGSPDEIFDADGRPYDHTVDLAATVDHLSRAGLLARRAEASRLVEDEGVTYGGRPASAGADGHRAPRRWSLDPLPVVLDAPTWGRLEPALIQRAELLDQIMADLYGPRTLLHRGVIPAEVVLGHPGFVRQADGMRLPGTHRLMLAAADLARAADGQWRVVADRAQAPSGAGYAIQARRIVGRVMPGLYRDTRLQRLRTFFDTLRSALQEVAPSTAEAPRVVILIPGPTSDTAFDHAFLATLLGYPLVTGEDLTVRDGQVYLRSLGRLEPVDVVLRRLGDADADPLELRSDSRVGVPGLLEAGRRGTVSVVNPIGSSVLESPALLPFLPAASRALLGEDLALPSAATWWCGRNGDLRHVLAHLDRLVVLPVRPKEPGFGSKGVVGSELSRRRLSELRRRIEGEPRAWCAQESLAMSTTPVVTARGLEARRFTVRTFAVARGGAFHVLPGGLGRLADGAGNHAASNSPSTPAKDVWVLAAADQSGSAAADVAWPRPRVEPSSAAVVLQPRVAESLFRLGSHAEQAEGEVRLLRVVDDLADDWTARPGTAGRATLAVMRETLDRLTGVEPGLDLLGVVAAADRPGTLAQAVRSTVDSAQAVREQLSLDTWIVLGSLDRVLAEVSARAAAEGPDADIPLQPVLARVLEGLLALAGLGAESMVRDVGWYFMDAGRRLTRATQMLTVLRYGLDREHPAAVQSMVLEAVLVTGESIITHRRRHPGRAEVSGVVELLALDRDNPRSVALQLDRLAEDLRHLPPAGAAGTDPAVRLRDITARLRELDQAAGARSVRGRRVALVEQIDVLLADLGALAAGLERAHFGHAAPPRPTAAISGWDS